MEGIARSGEYENGTVGPERVARMSSSQTGAVLGRVQTLFHLGAMGAWTDGQLVERFAAGGEGGETALEVLVARHGPMVLGICRRALADPHDVDDAFQATFLVLVQKAGRLRDRDLLGHWLYGVACRVASKARAGAARRRAFATTGIEPAMSAPDPDRREQLAALDEEIGRLPEKYRVPLVLCHLEGLRHHEVAHRLGCPVGTIESRLSRARERLRERLTRRGLAPTAGLLLAAMTAGSASAAVPPPLVAATLRAAARRSAGKAAAAATRPLLVARLATIAPALLALGVVAAALVGLATQTAPPRPPDPARRPPEHPASAAVPSPGRVASPARLATPEPTRDPSALAVPLSGITIDGRLDDWPSGMRRYHLLRVANQQPGRLDLKGADLLTSPDLSAYFQVGYDPERGRIYLAVVVRDDQHVVSSRDPFTTDASEIFVDGRCSDRQDSSSLQAERMPVIQYAGVPGPGPAYGDPHKTNPALLYARKRDRSSSEMEWRRRGDITIYEWSFLAYDRYPDRPTKLSPGKRIGLEVAVVDKDTAPDAPDPAAWVYWGPPWRGYKGYDSGSLGELILGDAAP
jgi:RNA polymerase sigma factor (sigma-70 family)